MVLVRLCENLRRPQVLVKKPSLLFLSVSSSSSVHIQANLEDDLVKEALKTGVDLRQYSKQVESELQRIEQASIKDCILQNHLQIENPFSI